MNPTADPLLTLLAALFALAGGLGIIYFVVRKFFRGEDAIETAPTKKASVIESPYRMLSEDGPRCCCGELATEPAPTLQRGRGSVVRDLLGMPPRYRRVVLPGVPVYCRPHAHAADAVMAQWLASQRAVVAQAYSAMAAGAAIFETEGLPRAVAEALSDDQRQRQKRIASARAVRTATSVTNGSGPGIDAQASN